MKAKDLLLGAAKKYIFYTCVDNAKKGKLTFTFNQKNMEAYWGKGDVEIDLQHLDKDESFWNISSSIGKQFSESRISATMIAKMIDCQKGWKIDWFGYDSNNDRLLAHVYIPRK